PDGRFVHHRCQLRSGWSTKLWTLDGEKPVVLVNGYQCIAFRADSRQAAISYDDGTVRILDLPSGKEVARWHDGLTGCIIRWNPKLAQLALRGGRLLKVVDVETGNVQMEKQFAASQMVTSLGWHPDGHIIACSDEPRIILLDARTGESVQQPLEGH